MFRWLFPKTDVKVPPVTNKLERERDVVGLTLHKEAILSRSISNQIQETLARGVVLELRR
jgi:hypothetical protein